MIRAFLLLAMLAACGAPVDAEPETVPVEVDVPVVEAEPGSCGVTLSPSAALLDVVTLQASRWSLAMGCNVDVGDGGLQVLSQRYTFAVPDDAGIERLSSSDPQLRGRQVCGGVTTRDSERLAMIATQPDVSCPSLHTRVAHEIGHLLSGTDTHAESGLMRLAAKDSDNAIDSSSLGLVCSSLPCVEESPEL